MSSGLDAAATSREPVHSARGEEASLLLIEDNLSDVDLVRIYLEDSYHGAEAPPRLQVARRLRDGIELLARESVDCVLLDLGLPDANGVDTLRRFREAVADVPVVVLTGHGEMATARRCLRRGAQEYLMKTQLGPHSLGQAIELAKLRFREAQAERRRVQEDRLRAVGMLAAGVAHEINNPLTYLEVNLTVAIEEVAALAARVAENSPADALAEVREALAESREGVHRISEIVGRLNRFARDEDADVKHAVSLSAVVEDAIRLTAHRFGQTVALDTDLPEVPYVLGHRGQLTQVVVNLLINALQAVEGQDGAVRVATSVLASRVLVDVIDNGVGMSARELDKAFDPFFTTKPAGAGTGLGLAVSRNIAESHGGALEATSLPGRGSRFRLSVPVAGPLAARDGGGTAPEGSETAPLRILLVDDEAYIRRSVARVLGDSHQLATSEDGASAIGLLLTGAEFDVVLCDLTMPGLSGADVWRWIMENRPELCDGFVLMSGGATEDVIRDLPDVQRLAKPFSRETLLRLIERLSRSPTGDD